MSKEEHLARWKELTLVVLILGLAIFLYMFHLDADPPNKISFSQGINTDPPAYTLFARHAVLTGEWNPLKDYRFPTHQYSLISGVAFIVFSIFGVSAWSTNFTAVVLSLLSILMFYLIVRKAGGARTALMTILLFVVVYLAIFFGRRPFLEVGMSFFVLAGLMTLAYLDNKKVGHFLFGIFLAASIVFGKLTGVAHLAIPVFYYAYKIVYLKRTGVWTEILAAAGGFVLVVGGYYFIIYAPHANEISKYVGQQAFATHGSPDGFTSFYKFVWKFVTFGLAPKFFIRMPALAVAATAAILIFTRKLVKSGRKSDENKLHSLWVAILGWLVGSYIFLMPWNYQPVRYLTPMILPLSALAAYFLVVLIYDRKAFNLLSNSIGFNITLFVLALILIYNTAANLLVIFGYTFSFKADFPYTFALVAVLAVGYYLWSRKKKKLVINIPPPARLILALCFIVYHLVGQGVMYAKWAETPLYSARQNSKDLGMVLSPGAVITGPYAPDLATDNNLRCLTNTFGAVQADSAVLRDFPVTHLVLDRSNIIDLKNDYPDLEVWHVVDYYVNNRKVGIYRVCGGGMAREAEWYLISSMEWAAHYYEANQPDSGDFYLSRFLTLYPENISGNMIAAARTMGVGDFDNTVRYLRKALDFSPTDFNLHYMMGRALLAKGQRDSRPDLLREGRQEIDMARRYNLGYHEFDDDIVEGNGGRDQNR